MCFWPAAKWCCSAPFALRALGALGFRPLGALGRRSSDILRRRSSDACPLVAPGCPGASTAQPASHLVRPVDVRPSAACPISRRTLLDCFLVARSPVGHPSTIPWSLQISTRISAPPRVRTVRIQKLRIHYRLMRGQSHRGYYSAFSCSVYRVFSHRLGGVVIGIFVTGLGTTVPNLILPVSKLLSVRLLESACYRLDGDGGVVTPEHE